MRKKILKKDTWLIILELASISKKNKMMKNLAEVFVVIQDVLLKIYLIKSNKINAKINYQKIIWNKYHERIWKVFDISNNQKIILPYYLFKLFKLRNKECKNKKMSYF